ncbi:peroxisomal leader peptide-processing protease-like [Plutella xylostella]|uniref:peroxisomal leader peptide-processing protease-like n=1 Tax=Plutella xylostella TaxID=51655 RepID=UPI002032E20F|nr:peroxisomal leader peptide-processing protease-like [Plutella xylostella]
MRDWTIYKTAGNKSIIVTFSSSKQLIGIVVCSVSWWRGEWVGLTLVAPLRAVLAAKLRLNDAVKEPPPPAKHLKILESIDSSLVLVRCGAAWGAGVYLGGGYVVTCAHVVRNYSSAKVSLYARGVKETAIVRYKTADDKAYDLALLFSNPENWTHLVPAHFSTETIKKGEPVLAAGFPFFNENNLEDLRPTVTSGHANNVSPSMIQTSCCVQSGFSGGAIYRITASSRVEVLGIIVCNAKTETGACFPYINMAVPASTFVHLLHTYMHDKDADKLKCIESDKEIIQSQWRLMPYRSKI